LKIEYGYGYLKNNDSDDFLKDNYSDDLPF
jgi:hypothetical protein